MFEIPRRRAKLPITASAQMISAQTGCRLALCLVMALRLQDQANVVALQSHRRSARPSMCCPASLVSRETMHLTSRALDRRALALKWSEQHADRVSASRTRCRLRRNTHPSACRSSARCPSRRWRGRHPRSACRADPTSHDKQRPRNRAGLALMSSCSALQAA